MQRSILTRFIFPALPGVLLCLLVTFTLTASQGSVEEASGKTIDKLVAELGSDRFETREAATRALKERVEAIPALRKARRSADLEVRRRVKDILKDLEPRRALQSVRKAKALGQAGRAVEAADRLAFAAECDVAGDEGWDGLSQLADRVIKCANPQFSSRCGIYPHQGYPIGEFRRYAKLNNPKEIAARTVEIDLGGIPSMIAPKDVKVIASRALIANTGGRLLLRGKKVSFTTHGNPEFMCGGMIASSGDVQIHGAHCSVIVAGGNIKNATNLINCVLICDGDVEFLSKGVAINTSIIVARGKVTCKGDEIRNCLIRSGHTLHLPNWPLSHAKTIDLNDGTPNPLAFVKFFELADVGLAAEDLVRRENSGAEGVRLQAVGKESPFAAGLHAGDVITAIEEEKTPTTEIFRRVLRRKLAQGGPLLTVTVRRSGKTMDVPLPVKD